MSHKAYVWREIGVASPTAHGQAMFRGSRISTIQAAILSSLGLLAKKDISVVSILTIATLVVVSPLRPWRKRCSIF